MYEEPTEELQYQGELPVPEGESGSGAGKVLISALVLLGVAAAALGLGYFVNTPRYLEKKLGRAGAVERWWRAILRSAARRSPSLKVKSGETAYQYAARVGSRLGDDPCSFTELANIVARTYYGEIKPPEREFMLVYRWFRKLRRFI